MLIKFKVSKVNIFILFILISVYFFFYFSSNNIALIKCIDGDTALFTKIGKTRFLYIDTPESTFEIEPYGKQASQFTCDLLTKAHNITYEYDSGDKIDKYGRTLAWIFVDGQLIQTKIAQAGFVKGFYHFQKTYKYESEIKNNLNDIYQIFND